MTLRDWKRVRPWGMSVGWVVLGVSLSPLCFDLACEVVSLYEIFGQSRATDRLGNLYSG